MSTYMVGCACGASSPVTATQAGSKIHCACGRTVDIPTLSTLRKSAGESATPQNAVERIKAMLQRGELPTGDICPYSGRPANDTILFHVQCERSWVRGGEMSPGKIIAYIFFLGWIGALIAYYSHRPREELGRDTSLTIPLRVSSDVRAMILRMRGQRKLKSLLSHVPAYAQLFAEFRDATVSPGYTK